MCLGIPGQIVAFVDQTGHLAKVDASGDWALIHVGFALSKTDEQEARRTLQLFAQPDPGFDQELEAFQGSEVTT